MWSVAVVILLPCFQRFLGFCQRAEERFVQEFVPELAVEAFDACGLGWFFLAQCNASRPRPPEPILGWPCW